MQILINNNIDREKWDDLISNSIYSSPFQTYEFYTLYNSVIGYSADAYAIEENNVYKAIIVVTIQKEQGIKSFFSKRGIVYGGPTLKKHCEIHYAFLLSEINQIYKNKLIYLEIRNNFNYNPFIGLYKKFDWDYEQRLNVQLEIQGCTFDEILTKMKYNRRREINLSMKEGTVVRLAENEKEIIQIYSILKELYTTRVKLPLPLPRFFLELFKSSIGKVFVVEHNNKIIGGSFCVFHREMSIYTLYYAGKREYHKKIFPTHLAITGVIDFAIQNNLKLVDFMGAGKPDEEYGVRDYKLQFGGDLVEHGRFIKVFNPLLFKTGKLGLSLMAKLK